MISSKVFTIAYLVSLAAASLSGVSVFSSVLPWPSLIIVWALILFGFGLHRRTHALTDVLILQQFHLTLVILDEAFEALTQEAEDHSWYSLIGSDPLAEVLRDDPRFSEFRAKVGLFP